MNIRYIRKQEHIALKRIKFSLNKIIILQIMVQEIWGQY